MVSEEAHLLLRSSISLKILECLAKQEKAMSPKQIAKEIDVARDNISTRIIRLNEMKLVECINPEARLWRFYKITKSGNAALKEAGEWK